MEVDNTLNLLSALVMKTAGGHSWVWPLSGDCPRNDEGAAEITG